MLIYLAENHNPSCDLSKRIVDGLQLKHLDPPLWVSGEAPRLLVEPRHTGALQLRNDALVSLCVNSTPHVLSHDDLKAHILK